MSPATAALDKVDQGTSVITSIGDEIAARFELFDQDRCNGLVGGLTLRKYNPYRQSRLVNDRVDLGAQSATRTTDGVIRTPFFPPAACWWARMIELSINCSDCGDLAAKISNILSQTPFLAHRLNRL